MGESEKDREKKRDKKETRECEKSERENRWREIEREKKVRPHKRPIPLLTKQTSL